MVDLHVITRHLQQKRIREMKIRIANLIHEVIANAETKIEAVKPMGREHRQIIAPCAAVVVPGLVFQLADKCAQSRFESC